MRAFLTAVLLCILVPAAALAADDKIHRHPKKVPNSYIVVLDQSVPLSMETAQDIVAKHKGTVTYLFGLAVHGFAARLGEQDAAKMARDERVRYIAEDGLFTVSTSQYNPGWALDRIDQLNLPVNGLFSYTYTGAGITAYIVDTGINNHVAQFGNRIVRQRNFSSENHYLEPPGPVDPDNTGDCYGHGTMVASVVGSATYGVAKNVSIVNVKVSPCLVLSQKMTEWVNGMNWMISDHDAHQFDAVPQRSVANISLSVGYPYPPMDDAVVRAIEHGITVVVAAGNANVNTNFQPQDACTSSPMLAGAPGQLNYSNGYGSVSNPHGHSAITVAASTPTDQRWPDSNYGPCVDLFAPGQNVSVLYPNGTGGSISGTSIAAPYVTGVAALRYEYFGTATPGVIQGSIKDNSTPNVMNGTSLMGSPNLLLYSGVIRRRPSGPS